MTLLHTPGETRDQISVWIPEWKVAIPADNIARAFPNISSIRGAPARDPELWYQSLDKIRQLRPEFLVPCHLFPVHGEKEIYDIITIFRDAIQFVNDQTIRFLNNGYEVDDVVKKVKLPPVMASHPYLQEMYGTVEWSVRGIVQSYLGWFDRHPVNLFPLSKQEQAKRYDQLLSRTFEGSPSGLEKMLIVAEEGLQIGNAQQCSSDESLRINLQWSLELLSQVLKAAEPDSKTHKQAIKQSISCLKQLADLTVCPNGKRYYLTCASELPTNFVKRITQESRPARIQQLPIQFTMKKMKYSFKAEACSDREEMTVIFVFSDVTQVHSYIMRHCILEYFDVPDLIPKDYDVKITGNSSVWKDLLTNKTDILTAQKNDDLKIDGNVEALKRFCKLLEINSNLHFGKKSPKKA